MALIVLRQLGPGVEDTRLRIEVDQNVEINVSGTLEQNATATVPATARVRIVQRTLPGRIFFDEEFTADPGPNNIDAQFFEFLPTDQYDVIIEVENATSGSRLEIELFFREVFDDEEPDEEPAPQPQPSPFGEAVPLLVVGAVGLFLAATALRGR